MTRTEQISAYLLERLALIRTGQAVTLWNGTTYTMQTDAGSAIYSQQQYTEDLTPPLLVLFTGRNSVSFDGDPPPEIGMENHMLEISIEGIIADNRSGAAGDALRADIDAAIRGDYTLGDLVDNMTGWESDSQTAIGDEIFSQVAVKFSVQYSTQYGTDEAGVVNPPPVIMDYTLTPLMDGQPVDFVDLVGVSGSGEIVVNVRWPETITGGGL